MAIKDKRQGFISDALDNGVPIEDINAVLAEKGEQPVSKIEEVIYNRALPKTGAIGLGLLGHFTGGPPLAFLGGFGGQTLVKSAQDIGKMAKGGYDTADNYGGAFNQAISNIGEGAGSGLGMASLSSMLNLGGAIMRPGATREAMINKLPDEKRLIKRDVLQENLLEVPKKYVDPETAATSRQQLFNLYQKIFPYTEKGATVDMAPKDKIVELYQKANQIAPNTGSRVTQPDSVDINNLYKQLQQMQSDSNAFNSSAVKAQTAADISSATRAMINKQTSVPPLEGVFNAVTKGELPVPVLNKLSQIQYSLGPLGNKFKYGATGAAGAALIFKLKSLLGL